MGEPRPRRELEGYYREPTIWGDRVVFVCETDLWLASVEGGRAQRLSVDEVGLHTPRLSPDGQWVAFVGRTEGTQEVYVMHAEGGHAERVTFQGAACLVSGWSRDGERVLYASDAEQPPRHGYRQWSVPRAGGPPALAPWGPADRLSLGPERGLVLGRNVGDPARWKRYRGGRTGELWIDREEEGRFEPLIALPGNLADPLWIGARIYFLSDHEGHGNVYSCDLEGRDLVRHTHHERYYARNASSDGRRIVYQSGGEIYLFDPAGEARKLPFTIASAKPQLRRRFVSAAEYLEDYDLHPRGHALALNARGKAFAMASWERAVHQVGERDAVRYRLTRWLAPRPAERREGDHGDEEEDEERERTPRPLERLVTVSDAPGEEVLEVHEVPDLAGAPGPALPAAVRRLEGLDIGRPIQLWAAPRGAQVALVNQRFELQVIDLEAGTARVLDTSPYGRIRGVAWSPDARWLAYGFQGTSRTSHIRIVEVETGAVHEVTRPVHADMTPSFDPGGKYLFFISYRTFNPVYDRLYFDLGFPRGGRPYVLPLRADLESPLRPRPRPLDGSAEAPDEADEEHGEEQADGEAGRAKEERKRNKKERKAEKKRKKKERERGEGAAPRPVRIDFEGIAGRVQALPVDEGVYGNLEAIEGKVLYARWPVEGSLGEEPEEESARGELFTFDLETRKEESFVSGVSGFMVGLDRKTLAYHAARKLRVVKATARPEAKGDAPSRASGWIDLSRPRLSVVPAAEWRQMYREAWRLQRDNFWNPTLSDIDWQEVYERYLPVLERVATRGEFSDLMWEVQGELGTSHAYEWGGDVRRPPPHGPGYLGADLRRDDAGWVIARLVRGDSWRAEDHSPLLAPGLDVREGDRLLAIDGVPLEAAREPGELLVNRAGTDVTLTVAREGAAPRALTVTTLREERGARYRDWVERTRRAVHERSGGRVGYVYVPNMGPQGYAEFHRYYQAEIDRPALLVDVRYNGGGHVSQLLLEKLARRRIGYDVPRYGQPMPYPEDSVLGPIACLTNERAGSDGDIFSHCFKLLKLGTLLGKRTWGGVVGIWPRHPLVDRSVTTQAEFAFWFEDVGWAVENYGTDPDVVVEIAPHDWAAGRDPQLEAGVDLLLRQLEEQRPAVPDFGPRPSLRAPKLPRP